MKSILLSTLLVLAPCCLRAQGTVQFSNGGGEPVTCCANGSIVNTPVGSTFMAALYWAPDGTTDDGSFIQLGYATGFGPVPGFFNGGTRTAPDIGYAMIQVRVWPSAFGSSYEQAYGGTGIFGKSNLIRVNTAGTPANLVASGLRGFYAGPALTCPEPSATCLALSGILSLLFLRRKRQS